MRMTMTDVSRPDYHGPIHALNKSSGQLRGNVMFNVTDEGGGGGLIPIQVPDTFLAIDLMAKASKDQLVKSQDLRQALNRGLLVLVDETEAMEINSRPGAAQEAARIRRQLDAAEVTQSASYAAASDARPPQSAPMPAEGNVASDDLEGIHPRLWGIETRIGEEGEMAAVNMLRAIIDELSVRDLRHVLGAAKAGNHRKLAKYCSAQIRKKKGLPPKERKRKAQAA